MTIFKSDSLIIDTTLNDQIRSQGIHTRSSINSIRRLPGQHVCHSIREIKTEIEIICR